MRHESPDVFLDPRVNREFVEQRWGRTSGKCKQRIASDLQDLDAQQDPIQINGKFYKLGQVTQGCDFHHFSPEWTIEATDVDSGEKVQIKYTCKKFFLELSPNREVVI